MIHGKRRVDRRCDLDEKLSHSGRVPRIISDVLYVTHYAGAAKIPPSINLIKSHLSISKINLKMTTSAPWEPEGPLVSTVPALAPHVNTTNSILGNSLPSTCVHSVTLVPLSDTHSEHLFANLDGPQNAYLWRYMPHEPINDYESFAEHVKFLIETESSSPSSSTTQRPPRTKG